MVGKRYTSWIAYKSDIGGSDMEGNTLSNVTI